VRSPLWGEGVEGHAPGFNKQGAHGQTKTSALVVRAARRDRCRTAPACAGGSTCKTRTARAPRHSTLAWRARSVGAKRVGQHAPARRREAPRAAPAGPPAAHCCCRAAARREEHAVEGRLGAFGQVKERARLGARRSLRRRGHPNRWRPRRQCHGRHRRAPPAIAAPRDAQAPPPFASRAAVRCVAERLLPAPLVHIECYSISRICWYHSRHKSCLARSRRCVVVEERNNI
jgi:hypothetical protein